MKNKSILNRVECYFHTKTEIQLTSLNAFTILTNSENIRDKPFHRFYLMNNKNPGNEAKKENADIDQSGKKIADI